jgi:hypothetical protein
MILPESTPTEVNYLIQTGIQFIFSEIFLSLLLGRIALPVQANEAPPGNRTK